ncbi:phage tail tube protein [Roseateles sp. DXS20W]|uniref:Phage tail tube protein n=1 Tax=Pelomonas lactea TaxID=3299030 RepID=A0ABW7GJX3_9BURK
MPMTHSRAYIKVDGALLETMPGPKWKLGGSKRTPVVGNRVLGYSEMTEPGELECELVLTQGMSLAALKDITDATLTIEADTGQTYVGRNAFVTDALEVTSGDGGKVALKFACDPLEEMGV